MTTREKIIVGFMCLTIVYGAYELLFNQSPSHITSIKSANPFDELKGFAASVSKKLLDEKVSKEYRYLISQAGNSWTKDPFLPTTRPLKKKFTLPSLPKKSNDNRVNAEYVYTGFLKIGDTKFAVINGMEYITGESINTDGLYVKSISSKNVIIAKAKGGETIQLPLTEIEPTPKKQTP